VIEPRLYKNDYVVRLSASELRELKLATIKDASVFTILTIPSNLTEMTANLKAPVVINVKEKVAKQVVLQENDQPIKHPMFKELRAQIQNYRASVLPHAEKESSKGPISVGSLPITTRVELI
jgi:flagellar assembly factor FliW